MFKSAKRFFRAIWEVTSDSQFMELMIIAVFTLLVGAAFYHYAEGWSFLDSFYFSVTTLTTVGYGDLFPSTDASKLFTSFYILAGVGILLGFVNAVATHARDKSPLNKLFERR
ncbi:MAG: potassium channel family protein [Candidatus Pacebacteria bacterium]|jgi:voltage-gated potassium channel Kch|nr:potassium channel family protein [Candidatus Paceibacterota bacterium]